MRSTQRVPTATGISSALDRPLLAPMRTRPPALRLRTTQRPQRALSRARVTHGRRRHNSRPHAHRLHRAMQALETLSDRTSIAQSERNVSKPLKVMLAIAGLTQSSKPWLQRLIEAPQSKAKKALLHLPAKKFAAARRRKKATFTARFVGDCQFDLSCNSYGKTKRLGGLFRPRRVGWLQWHVLKPLPCL